MLNYMIRIFQFQKYIFSICIAWKLTLRSAEVGYEKSLAIQCTHCTHQHTPPEAKEKECLQSPEKSLSQSQTLIKSVASGSSSYVIAAATSNKVLKSMWLGVCFHFSLSHLFTSSLSYISQFLRGSCTHPTKPKMARLGCTRREKSVELVRHFDQSPWRAKSIQKITLLTYVFDLLRIEDLENLC